METFFKTIIENGNTLSSVTILIVIFTAFVWAISTEWLFTGPRGREMKVTITKQAEALETVGKELREIERDYDKMEILFELAKSKTETPTPFPQPRRRPRGRR